ncbi:GNAT family N-acetyltransferase [Propionibacteriaceae bacterium Y1700]|uniref:GNAT family N-acetyltransferase n=1 Tax=Microlunatus sp. Y1700 TaxID=3418487 RepID=UPI003DA6E410
MTLVVAQPSLDELSEVVSTLAQWQYEGAPLQLHPGDLGWYWQFGGEKTAAAVRTWRRDGELLAVGLVDGPDLIRIGMSQHADHDQELARRMVSDFIDPARGVLPAGPFHVEARAGDALQALLEGEGWEPGEAWTPLRRRLDTPVEDPGLRIEVIAPGREEVLTAVHQSAFGSPRFDVERWRQLINGPAHDRARGLVGFDEHDNAVATVTVWSAGEGRPGLLEPMGVHADHRGHGYGRAISVAAAAALQELGASSAVVGTPSDNLGAVATYVSAGFAPDAQSLDRRWTAA